MVSYGSIDKVWGGASVVTIVITPDKGFVKVMDMQRGDVIEGAVAVAPKNCPAIVIELMGERAWIRNGTKLDVYAFVKGADASS